LLALFAVEFFGLTAMRFGDIGHFLGCKLRAFRRSRRGNVAIIFGLSLVPLCVAAGAGLDLSRAMIVRARMVQALDAAGLAVGSDTGDTQQNLQTLAQKYFNANYTTDSSFGTPAPVSVTIANQSVTLGTNISMPTVLVRVADIIGCTKCDNISVTASSEVVWGQTKLWVSLVLDNTGSMTQTDSTGTSKISALKSATHQLLTILQNAAAHPGDVKVSIIPFSKDVNLGTGYAGVTWIDWTDWAAAPPNSTPAVTKGPGDTCPYGTTTSPYGYGCTTGPTNGASSSSTILSTCTINGTSRTGCICPGVDDGGYYNGSQHSGFNGGHNGHYYNGCYDSVYNGTKTTVSSGSNATCNGYVNCSCTGSFSSKVCKANNYSHTWYANAHSTWTGCIMDRTQSYDIQNTTPTGTSTDFPAENAQSCPPGHLGTLSYDWTSLSSQVDAMTAQGSTNQTVGLAWGWQALTDGNPLNAGTLPGDTHEIIILLSDGFNTQDRWYGNGIDQSTGTNSVDDRMNRICTNVHSANITVYTVFVDLAGTQGSSTVLQNCASDSSKYFDLTTSGSIITTFNQIATQITQLRVAQ
jgi:Flp pilus assembly protein TadG